MTDIDRLYRTADGVELASLVAKGEVTPLDLVEAGVRAIEEMNPALNAVVHKLYDMGRDGAKAVTPGAGPLAGVPFLLKELASSWDRRAGHELLALPEGPGRRRTTARSAGACARAGLLLLGKSNAPENGWCISTEPALYGATVNPWDASVTAGGSSGGTAVAVATGMVPMAEASDGAGSIRVPASCCGVVGLKPSRGRVTLSPFADYWAGGAYFLCNSRTVRDTAAYLDVMGGALPGDPYELPTPEEPVSRGGLPPARTPPNRRRHRPARMAGRSTRTSALS
jgi:amidase